MNNKGFAVSTILYGLSIMGFLIVVVLISLMSSNRSNTKDFIQQVEDELNRYASKQTVITPYIDSNGDNNTNYPQEFFTLEGSEYWYKIELWNNGIYKSATFKVSPNTIIFFYIGNGDIPTIACLDGDSRENCAPGGNKLIMSTAQGDAILGDNGINDNDNHKVTQGTDWEEDINSGPKTIEDTDTRVVYLKNTTETDNRPHNIYQIPSSDSKARISLVSLDEKASYLEEPDTNIAGVFYIQNGNKVYSCNGTSVKTNADFTGDQDQQWTVVGDTATNVKYKNCSFTPGGSVTYHNALF